MCTFESEQSIVVCDLAIHQVREAVSAAFGDAVQFTPITGEGTRVEVPPTVDEGAFQVVARAAIAAAQERPEGRIVKPTPSSVVTRRTCSRDTQEPHNTHKKKQNETVPACVPFVLMSLTVPYK